MPRTPGIQRADDPAKSLHIVWHGTDMGEWPFKARYSAWALAAALSFACSMAYLNATPRPIVALAACYLFGRRVGRGQPPMIKWITAGSLLMMLVLLYSPLVLNPRPFPWWVAFPAGVATGVYIARKIMSTVTPNTPLRYWRWLLGAISKGPRPRRDPMVFDVRNPMPEPFDLPPLIFDGLASTGGKVAQYRERSTIEANRWLPANPDRAGEFQAWLNQYGYTFTVNDGGSLTIMNDPFAMVEVQVQPGQHAFFELDRKGKPSTTVKTLPHEVFKDRYVILEQMAVLSPLSAGDMFQVETPVMEVIDGIVDRVDVDGERLVVTGTRAETKA